VQQPHLPLLVGGDSRPALRRAARLGDGWLPWLTTRDEMPGCLAYLREQREEHGRSGPFQVLALLADFPAEDRLDMNLYHVPSEAGEARDMLGALQEARASGATVHLPQTHSLEECLGWLEGFAEQVAPAFRSTEEVAPA
jgi:alkanesulfonate monooxygenase SsuD/methylene tetrahydromethanopterin reductase-like flavin-dependent oxidoreductase (luciferase family)